MSNQDMGGPAYPQTITAEPSGDRMFPGDFGLGGMTLWDYYAAAALQGLCACSGDGDMAGWKLYAERDAARIADAMLAERGKRQEGGDGE